jgi:hypothetical protein
VGLYSGACGADGETSNLAELGWKDGELKRCLNPGTYLIVVDESRAQGAAPPANGIFTIEVLCEPWSKGDAESFKAGPCGIGGEGFLQHALWAVYVVPGPVFEGQFLQRVPGSAQFAFADGTGRLVGSDLEQVASDEPVQGEWIEPAVVAGAAVPPGIYSVVLDDGDHFYRDEDDYLIAGVPIGPCEQDTCPADCGDSEGSVGIADLLALLAQWGAPGPCDFDGSGTGISDLLEMLGDWGTCF